MLYVCTCICSSPYIIADAQKSMTAIHISFYMAQDQRFSGIGFINTKSAERCWFFFLQGPGSLLAILTNDLLSIDRACFVRFRFPRDLHRCFYGPHTSSFLSHPAALFRWFFLSIVLFFNLISFLFLPRSIQLIFFLIFS